MTGLRLPPALLVVLAALLAHAASLGGGFHYDDEHVILLNKRSLTDPSTVGRFLADPGLFSGIGGNALFRPVTYATMVLDAATGGWEGEEPPPFPWHATNLVLHAAAAAALFHLLRRILGAWTGGDGARAETAAALGALWFALQPVNGEVVNYVSARSESLAALFFLLALLAHHAAWEEGTAPLRRGLLVLGAAGAAALSHGSKETGVLLAAVAAAIEVWGRPGERPLRERLVAAALRAAPLAAVLGFYLLFRKGVLAVATVDLAARPAMEGVGPDPYMGGGRSIAAHLLTQARVLAAYALLLLFPVDLAPDHGVRIAAGLDGPTLAALALLAAGAFLVVRAAVRGSRAAPLAASWCAAALAPSVLVPLNVVMNEHRLYLATTALAIPAGLGLAALLDAGRRAGRAAAAAGTVVAIFLAYALVDVDRARAWSDPMRLWTEAVASSPGSWRARLHLGVEHFREATRLPEGEEALAEAALDRAIGEFRRAHAIYPGAFETRLDMGLVHLVRGQLRNRTADPDAPPPHPKDYEEALRWFTLAERASPGSFRARSNRCTALALLGRTEEAIREFETMARSDTPRTTYYDYPLAEWYRRVGRTDDALRRLDHVLSLKKEERRTVLLKKADVCISAGRFADADAVLQDLLREFGDRDPLPFVMKARALAAEGDPAKLDLARGLLRRAVEGLGYRPGPRDRRMLLTLFGTTRMPASGTGGK